MQPQFCIPSPDLAITRAYFERLQFVVQAADQALWVSVGAWPMSAIPIRNSSDNWRYCTIETRYCGNSWQRPRLSLAKARRR